MITLRVLPLAVPAVLVSALLGCRSDRVEAKRSETAPAPSTTHQSVAPAPARPAPVVELPAPSPMPSHPPPEPAHISQSANEPPQSQELIGQHVRISLRRDALGLAAASTPEPDANMIAGKQVMLSGVVERFSNGWLILKTDGKRYWIATSGILLIEQRE